MTKRLILGDVETSGLGHGAKIVEIAWLELDNDLNILDEKYSLIDPEVPIEPGAAGVHHITNEKVADEPTIEQFFEFFVGGPLVGDIVLIAHNSSFDRRFFDPHCDKINAEIDTLRLARKYYPDEQNHKLQTLRYSLGLDDGSGEVAHSALGDVKVLLKFFRMLVDKAEISPLEMVAEADKPIFLHSLPFGKHRGTPILDVPKDYLKWLSRQDNIDKDLAYTLEKVLSM